MLLVANDSDSLVHITLGLPTLVLICERLWAVVQERKHNKPIENGNGSGNGYLRYKDLAKLERLAENSERYTQQLAKIDKLIEISERTNELLEELVINSRVDRELRKAQVSRGVGAGT